MKRILITGGFGFLGGRIAQKLAESQNATIVLGSRISRDPPDWLPDSDTVQTIWDSVGDLTDICRDVDVIVHLAAMNAEDARLDPDGAFESNVCATVRLLQAAKKSHVASFIYLSTVHVYGTPLAGQIDEETMLNPVGPYATTHRAAEDAVLAAAREGGINGIVVRLSNAFGAPTSSEVNCWHLLVNDLCRQAATTNRLALRSGGDQQRDFISVPNVTRAITYFSNLSHDHTGIFNLGGQVSCSVFEMANYVADCCFNEFGERPHVDRQSDQKTNQAPLEVRTDKLLGLGYCLLADQDKEMSKLLRFCTKIYS